MPIRIVQADAFTNRAFEGNPAAVCVLNETVSELFMRNVAREMNLSETAFLTPGPDGFSLRWFTPAVEVALCGHATLASAHVLWEDGHLPRGEQARFQTASGLLTADQRGDWIEMDFPAKGAVPAEPPAGLLASLGVPATAVSRNEFDYLVEVETEQIVRAAAPNYSALRSVQARGVILTSRSSSDGFDFVSRFFAPAAGVDEDPVTGSAHCALAPYWSERLGKTAMTGRQLSARGGTVRVRMAGLRVLLAGQALTTLRGELTCNPGSW